MSALQRQFARLRAEIDDPHMSAFVARIYDGEHTGDGADIAWAVALAAGGDVVDLGCGTGRLTLPLARAGCRVLALDHSPPMLARLRQKLAQEPAAVRERVTVLQGDLTDWSPPNGQPPFALALFGYNTFGALLSADEQRRCLDLVHANLATGGVLAIATAAVSARLLLLPEGLEQEAYHRAAPELGPGAELVRRDIHRWTNETLQLRRLAAVYDIVAPDGGRRREQFEYAARYTGRWELEHLLRCADFRDVQAAGDYAGAAFRADGGLLVVTARA